MYIKRIRYVNECAYIFVVVKKRILAQMSTMAYKNNNIKVVIVSMLEALFPHSPPHA